MLQNNIPTILIVESDDNLLTVLSYNLERSGFIVNTAKDATTALLTAERVRPDIVILEENLSGKLSSSEICTILENKPSTKHIPVLLITLEAEKAKKLQAQHSNIIEFVVKPFAQSDIIAKVKSLYKKEQPKSSNHQLLNYKNLSMNTTSYRVTKDGQAIHLGPTEFKILQCLMQLPSRILSREDIMSHVWGYNSQIEPRTIDVHINRLRTALKNDNQIEAVDKTPSIKTIRSAGYCLN